ncbi:MAG: acetolactate synthase I/II/III large subunit [Erysipelotrichaceae bacterium]|nr:MAG: acetolactate synthase I/II/III large [Erysipelotrichaceae bacterium]TXT18475.1 MAG: acetolactate synthase I/II/III large subunit [Erysipelotrichaceae bacterium]
MKKRIADILIETLVERGIIDCFAVVGGGAMYLDNALALNENMNKVFCHHEQACSMAAEAYSRYSGVPALVCVTSGPGATNAITGVMGAWQDNIPMVVLSGQVRYAISVESSGLPLRYRGVQEFDIINSVKNMTKYALMLKDPLSARQELNKAIDIAVSGRKGPVWLDVPQDIQNTMVEVDDLYPNEVLPAVPSANELDVIELIKILKVAKRPMILAGSGIAESGNIDQFRTFADTLQIPVVSAMVSLDASYRENELFFGMSGAIGPRVGNFILQNADVILTLGCSLGFQTTGFAQDRFAPNAKIISVDVDEFEMKKPGVRVDSFIHSDLDLFFKVAKNKVENLSVSKEWIAYCTLLKSRFSPFDPANGLSKDERVCMYQFWKEFENHEPRDSIVALGNNTASSAKCQIGIKHKDQRIIVNKNCGSMGDDLPAAVGAAIAAKKTIYCCTGDGSIMMNLQELQTIKHYDLPIKVVVFSNDGYNAIRQTSKNFFNNLLLGCTPESGISFPDFGKVAETFGFEYKHCKTNGDVAEALNWFFAQPGRLFLEIDQKLDDPVTPKVMSRLKPDGTYSTPAIQDMFPFLDKEEIDGYMLW